MRQSENFNVRITDASEQLLDGLERIEKACFSSPMTRAQLAFQLPGDRYVMLCAMSGGEPVGWAGFMYVLDEGYVSNVAVLPEYRRMGIGEGLMEGLIDRCAEKKLSFLTLEVRQSNAPAIKMYEKFSFQTVGKRKNYYANPSEDAILMTKYF